MNEDKLFKVFSRSIELSGYITNFWLTKKKKKFTTK